MRQREESKAEESEQHSIAKWDAQDNNEIKNVLIVFASWCFQFNCFASWSNSSPWLSLSRICNCARFDVFGEFHER